MSKNTNSVIRKIVKWDVENKSDSTNADWVVLFVKELKYFR
jgi:hypothetical protein